MGKNQSPSKPFGKSPQNKSGPQSMKKGGPPNKPSPFGKPTPKQFQAIKSGQTPKQTPKNLPSPKQQLNFQTPKQTPGSGKKQQFSGKKTTPHPVKGKPQKVSDEDDEFDSEEFDEMEDDSMEDGGSLESLEDEESDDEKPANGSVKKQLQVKGARSAQPSKVSNGKPTQHDEESDDEDEDFDSEEDDEEDEDESEEDEEDSEDVEEPPKKNLAAAKDKKASVTAQKPGMAQKPGTAAAQKAGKDAVGQKGKAQAFQQQQSKQVKRPAPEEESDDEEDEDEEDEDEEDEDEEDESEEDEEESDDEEIEIKKGAKKGQQQPAQKGKAAAQPQKKMKTNEGAAVTVDKSKQPGAMPTKLDKKLQDETEQRKRERDARSLFIKQLPHGTTDEQIKSLSSDILSINRKHPKQTWCWLNFASEQVCQKNYEKLKSTKLGSEELFVDFCGDKSKAGKKKSNAEERVDALRLYVGNLPANTTEADVKTLFPTAASIFYRSDRKFAFANFETPEKARQAFESNKEAKIKGLNVVVAFAKIYDKKEANKKKPDAVKKFAKNQASGKMISRG